MWGFSVVLFLPYFHLQLCRWFSLCWGEKWIYLHNSNVNCKIYIQKRIWKQTSMCISVLSLIPVKYFVYWRSKNNNHPGVESCASFLRDRGGCAEQSKCCHNSFWAESEKKNHQTNLCLWQNCHFENNARFGGGKWFKLLLILEPQGLQSSSFVW